MAVSVGCQTTSVLVEFITMRELRQSLLSAIALLFLVLCRINISVDTNSNQNNFYGTTIMASSHCGSLSGSSGKCTHSARPGVCVPALRPS